MPTGSDDDLEARVTALEHKVRDIAHGAAAARVLAGAADRDVSELRAELRGHTSVLNTLRETQLEQGEQIASLRSEMREGFAKVNVGMAQITALLTNKSPGADQ